MKDFILFFIIIQIFALVSCSMMAMEETPPPAEIDPADILLIVEESILTSISDQLAVYSDDILAEGGSVEIRPFSTDDTVENLKSMIILRRETIDGAFLVGDLPTAWYEQSAFGKEEEFPIDLFLMDLDAVWSDENGNGIYDKHSPLNLSVYISRINGTVDELNSYFSKLHNYRTGNFEYLGGAFIFKDDDWFDTYRSSSFGLDRMYTNVQINESKGKTNRDSYLYRLSYDGADYVYQWIHATPTSLYVSDDGYYNTIKSRDISTSNIRGRFLNMFNCKGARYTQSNLAMTYLTDTETGIAVTGSTKVGGNLLPAGIHRTLILGSSWGNAFKSWYNYYGKNDDEWFLGMTILGDPAISIQDSQTDRSLTRSSFIEIFPPASEAVELLGQNLSDFEVLESTF